MSPKRWIAERALELLSLSSRPRPAPASPRSIFVLRNNDIGDLLVITPLFEALRRKFPDARIVAGVGEWSVPVLDHNPHLSGCLVLSAPWHNKYVSPAGTWPALRYVLTSAQVRQLARERYEVGIDVLGSPWGSLLFMRAGIRCRFGVRGYAGGDTVTSASVAYDDRKHVGRAAVEFAELLGAADLPRIVPQLFLTPDELLDGDRRWSRPTSHPGSRPARVLLAPGAGLPEKRWPSAHFRDLMRLMAACADMEILITGGRQDQAFAGELAASASNARVVAGQLGLRQTIAAIARADAVITNASFVMHAAAAFGVRTLVVLGPELPPVPDHERQWGYPETQRQFGRASAGASLASARDVFDALLGAG